MTKSEEEITDSDTFFFFIIIVLVSLFIMGNTTTCSPKPPSPSKRTSPTYRLKPSSPLPTHVHRCKEQNHSSSSSSPKYKGNLFISIHSLFANIHWLNASSVSNSQESAPLTLFSFASNWTWHISIYRNRCKTTEIERIVDLRSPYICERKEENRNEYLCIDN